MTPDQILKQNGYVVQKNGSCSRCVHAEYWGDGIHQFCALVPEADTVHPLGTCDHFQSHTVTR